MAGAPTKTSLMALSVAQLREECRDRQLRSSGRKADLVDRILGQARQSGGGGGEGGGGAASQ